MIKRSSHLTLFFRLRRSKVFNLTQLGRLHSEVVAKLNETENSNRAVEIFKQFLRQMWSVLYFFQRKILILTCQSVLALQKATPITFAMFCSFQGKRTLNFPSKRKFQFFKQPKYSFDILLNSFRLKLIPNYYRGCINF